MNKRKISAKKVLILFTLLLLLTVIASVSFAYYLNSPVDDNSEETIFLVRSGDTLRSAAVNLQDQGFIRSYYTILAIHKIIGNERTLKTGSYRIGSSWSSYRVYNHLIEGEQELVSVTIPEGMTLRGIATLLDQKNVLDKDVFIDGAFDGELLDSYEIPGSSFEGYLFPDTYLFPGQYDVEYVIGMFMTNFQLKMDQIYPDWRELTAEQLNDKIIMASIVEKEYRNAAEAPIIASVFYNRLEHWYPRLESCATVTYVITDLLGAPHPERLTTEDIEMDNPYNTYEYSGLPPGPISNPGAVALDGAFNPATTDFLYFVVKDQVAGTHNFSNNYNEFQQYKWQYLRTYRSK